MSKPRLLSPALPAVLALALVLIAAGCAQVPQAASYPYSTQQKMQAVHHWDVLAADLAGQVVAAAPAELHLAAPPAGASPFQQAFHDLLLTHLINSGVEIRTNPAPPAPTFEYRLQTVRHQAARPDRRPPPGAFTALTGGLIVVRDAIKHGSSGRAWKGTALAGAIVADLVWDTMPSATDHELLVTSSITRGDQYLFRRSDIYYINGADAWQYRQRTTPAREGRVIEITG